MELRKANFPFRAALFEKSINNYTKEAGVRNLERLIGQICRKTARLIMEDGKEKVTVTGKNLESFWDRRNTIT